MSCVFAKRVMARWVPRLARTWMMALTDAEISAKVKAERRLVGTSSCLPVGGFCPVDFSQMVLTSLVPTRPAPRLTPVPSSLMKRFIPSTPCGRKTDCPQPSRRPALVRARAWPAGGGFFGLTGRRPGAELDHLVRTVAIGFNGRCPAAAQGNGLPLAGHGVPGRGDDLELAPDDQGPVGADHNGACGGFLLHVSSCSMLFGVHDCTAFIVVSGLLGAWGSLPEWRRRSSAS